MSLQNTGDNFLETHRSLPRPHSASPGASHVASRTPAANRSATAAQPPTHGHLEPGSLRRSVPSHPTTSAAGGRVRQNLNALEATLRVIINVKHNDSSKPLPQAKSSTSGRATMPSPPHTLRNALACRVQRHDPPQPHPGRSESPPITNHTRVAASKNCLRAWMFCDSVGL
jgi:hypothetical protein